jgi:hypothetical protein
MASLKGLFMRFAQLSTGIAQSRDPVRASYERRSP